MLSRGPWPAARGPWPSPPFRPPSSAALAGEEAGSEVGIGAASLRDIIAHLEETYCHSIGIE